MGALAALAKLAKGTTSRILFDGASLCEGNAICVYVVIEVLLTFPYSCPYQSSSRRHPSSTPRTYMPVGALLARLHQTYHRLTLLCSSTRPGSTARSPSKGASALAEPVRSWGNLAACFCPRHHRRYIDRCRNVARCAVLQRAAGREGGQARHDGSFGILEACRKLVSPRISCSSVKTTQRAKQPAKAAEQRCGWAECAS